MNETIKGVVFSVAQQPRSRQVMAESSSTNKQCPHLIKENRVDVNIKCGFSFSKMCTTKSR